MRILADENIPLVDEFFADFGKIHRLPGRSITADDLREVDALLVRSVTRVDRQLLAGSPVRFVGTCTIGTDHLDLDWFVEAGIHWSSAPGCNARGVVDYVLGAIWALAERTGQDPATRCYGVVGAGQVGGRLVEVLRGLGWQVLVCDPPRQAAEQGDFVDLAEIIERCEVISLHTPLQRGGDWPSWHLLDAQRLVQLREGCWLINASRGEVIDNVALRELLKVRPDLRVALDVWEGEPQVDVALAARCDLATPHIAGYSLDGKQRGTAQIYQAFCQWQGIAPQVSLDELLPAAWLGGVEVAAPASVNEVLATLCRAVYDPRRDDADFRRSLCADVQQQRLNFDALRKGYPVRRELPGLRVGLRCEDAALAAAVRALGCQLS